MHINNNKGIQGNWLIFRHFLTYQLHCFIQLSLQLLTISFNFILFNTLLHLSCPMNLATIQNTLAGMVQNPVLSRPHCIIFNRFQQNRSDGLFHLLFHLIHPVLHILLLGVHEAIESNSLVLGRKHGNNRFVSALVELYFRNILEHLLKERLHC